jgi:hypothetical protein
MGTPGPLIGRPLLEIVGCPFQTAKHGHLNLPPFDHRLPLPPWSPLWALPGMKLVAGERYVIDFLNMIHGFPSN